MKSLYLLIKISRPYGWFIGPLVFLIGLYYSGAEITYEAVLEILMLSFPLSIILYGINDLYDFDSDRLNPRKNERSLNPPERKLILVASGASAVLLFVSSLLTYDVSNMISMLLLVLLSWGYSAPPLRLKERPPLDSFSNGALFFVVFSLGWSFGGGVWDIPVKIYYVALCVMGIHAYASLMDYSVDKAAGHRTLAVVFGKRAASLFSFAAFLSALLFANIGRPYINYYFAFCSLIFLVSAIFSSEKLAIFLFKLIFVGFIVTALLFVLPYLFTVPLF